MGAFFPKTAAFENFLTNIFSVNVIVWLIPQLVCASKKYHEAFAFRSCFIIFPYVTVCEINGISFYHFDI